MPTPGQLKLCWMRVLVALVLGLLVTGPSLAEEPVLVDSLTSMNRTFSFYHKGEFVAFAIKDGDATGAFLLTRQEAVLFKVYLDDAVSKAVGLASGADERVGAFTCAGTRLSVTALKFQDATPAVVLVILGIDDSTSAAFPIFFEDMKRFQEGLADTVSRVERSSGGTGAGPQSSGGKQAGRMEVQFQYVDGGELRALAPEGHTLNFVCLPSVRALDASGRQHEVAAIRRGTPIEIEYSEQEAGQRIIKTLRLKE